MHLRLPANLLGLPRKASGRVLFHSSAPFQVAALHLESRGILVGSSKIMESGQGTDVAMAGKTLLPSKDERHSCLQVHCAASTNSSGGVTAPAAAGQGINQGVSASFEDANNRRDGIESVSEARDATQHASTSSSSDSNSSSAPPRDPKGAEPQAAIASSQSLPESGGGLSSGSQPEEAGHEGGGGGGGLGRLLQNFNSAGISLFLSLLKGKDRQLVIPHLSVPSIATINWGALRAAGFKGVVFDKDNTLSQPYAMEVDPSLMTSLAECLREFGDGRHVALYSNSAGLEQYDPQGEEAQALEAALGITVMRHKEKKPAGGKEEVEAHFGCEAHELLMIGDRYLTDIVFGNRHGMLTIRPEPLTTKNEPIGVRLARKAENYFVARWSAAGVQAPEHRLFPAQDQLSSFTK